MRGRPSRTSSRRSALVSSRSSSCVNPAARSSCPASVRGSKSWMLSRNSSARSPASWLADPLASWATLPLPRRGRRARRDPGPGSAPVPGNARRSGTAPPRWRLPSPPSSGPRRIAVTRESARTRPSRRTSRRVPRRSFRWRRCATGVAAGARAATGTIRTPKKTVVTRAPATGPSVHPGRPAGNSLPRRSGPDIPAAPGTLKCARRVNAVAQRKTRRYD